MKKAIIVGCLLVLLLLGSGILWLYTAGKPVVASALRDQIAKQIDSSGLSDRQKAGLIREVDRLADGFTAGEISLTDLIVITDELNSSTAMSALRTAAAKGDPIKASQLSPSEKREAYGVIDRFVHGLFEDRIPASAIDEILTPLLATSGKFGEQEFRSDLTDAELRAALAKAKSYADQAGVGEARIEPDVAGEVREIVDGILSAKGR